MISRWYYSGRYSERKSRRDGIDEDETGYDVDDYSYLLGVALPAETPLIDIPTMESTISGRRLKPKRIPLSTTLRTTVLERDGFQCTKCERNEVILLQVDHLNGDRSDNRLENLSTLCYGCHKVVESTRAVTRKRRKYYGR